MWILRHILLLEIFYPCAVLFYYSDWLMVFIYFELEVLFESSANCWIGRFGGWRNSWCCPRIQYGNSISAKARERTQMAAFLYRGPLNNTEIATINKLNSAFMSGKSTIINIGKPPRWP
ncbi:uncharacterized protein [Elaeis guineensis]|uniref:uncharacterized protein isoform X2 n=1 Tax=Elaeis guineensis var. tenera TaxID=51953 RepID=UPI003C6CDBD7